LDLSGIFYGNKEFWDAMGYSELKEDLDSVARNRIKKHFSLRLSQIIFKNNASDILETAYSDEMKEKMSMFDEIMKLYDSNQDLKNASKALSI
jgi:hypothetical protein